MFALSTRRVSGLMMINRSTMNHQSRREPQHALRVRLRELARAGCVSVIDASPCCSGVEGWLVNAKRIYRLYTEDGLGCALRSARRWRGAHAYRPSAQRGRMKSGQWIFLPPAYSMGAGSGCLR